MGNDTRIGVDVAKAVVEVAVSDRPGHVVQRERLPRAQFLPFMAQQPQATVVMEACGSAHYWGRRIQDLGHKVVLLPATPRPPRRPLSSRFGRQPPRPTDLGRSPYRSTFLLTGGVQIPIVLRPAVTYGARRKQAVAHPGLQLGSRHSHVTAASASMTRAETRRPSFSQRMHSWPRTLFLYSPKTQRAPGRAYQRAR
jgi:hypothetical protein